MTDQSHNRRPSRNVNHFTLKTQLRTLDREAYNALRDLKLSILRAPRRKEVK